MEGEPDEGVAGEVEQAIDFKVVEEVATLVDCVVASAVQVQEPFELLVARLLIELEAVGHSFRDAAALRLFASIRDEDAFERDHRARETVGRPFAPVAP